MINKIAQFYKESFNAKPIPSLDGLRALSVFMVVLGHLFLINNHGRQAKLFIYQDLGVSLFFVISGYLITGMLLKELREKGSINIRVFLLKRLFRIFPAYYFFLLVTYFTFPYFGIEVDRESLISCIFYLGYYYPPDLLSYWAHSWSLAIEEQFYLICPSIIKFLKSEKKVTHLFIFLILVSPLVRLVTYYLIPIYKHKYQFLLHTRMDTLLVGCLYALKKEDRRFQGFAKFCQKKGVFCFSSFYLLICYPVLNWLFLGKFKATLGYTLEAFFLLSIIIHVIDARGTWYFKVLNSKTLIHFGSLSYGIYLWQQPFTYIQSDLIYFHFPFNFISIYVLTIVSYLLIEQPILRLRSKVI